MRVALDCRIDGDPVGKGRPRCSCVGGRPRLRTPTTTREWETSAAAVMAAAYNGDRPLDGALCVRIASYRRRPKTHKPTVECEPCAVGTDVDNIAKAVLDALQLAGVVEDDRTVVELVAAKYWCAQGMRPGVWVRVLVPGDDF